VGYCGGVPPLPGVDYSHWDCTAKRTDGCPDALPTSGSPCTGTRTCTYSLSCCTQQFTCGASGKWVAGVVACPG
jgi:hypothetical protein